MKSKLKTMLAEAYKVNRKEIIFYHDAAELNIKIANKIIFKFNIQDDPYCCGIIHLGNTQWDYDNVAKINSKEFGMLLMDHVYRTLKRMVEIRDLNNGLVTWSHTSDNFIAEALMSEMNTEGNWKLTHEFFNPNSGNEVQLFHADISDNVDHQNNDDDYDDYDSDEYDVDDEEEEEIEG